MNYENLTDTNSHYEIERKFVIEYPAIELLENYPSREKLEINQTYIITEDGVRARIRQIFSNGSYTYLKTVKKRISDIRRIETENEITFEEYSFLLEFADKTRNTINKTRYRLPYMGKCVEVDIFPFWTDKAIAEIELSDENDEFAFPDIIKVIKEVTDDKNYTNSSLAKNLGKF